MLWPNREQINGMVFTNTPLQHNNIQHSAASIKFRSNIPRYCWSPRSLQTTNKDLASSTSSSRPLGKSVLLCSSTPSYHAPTTDLNRTLVILQRSKWIFHCSRCHTPTSSTLIILVQQALHRIAASSQSPRDLQSLCHWILLDGMHPRQYFHAEIYSIKGRRDFTPSPHGDLQNKNQGHNSESTWFSRWYTRISAIPCPNHVTLLPHVRRADSSLSVQVPPSCSYDTMIKTEYIN